MSLEHCMITVRCQGKDARVLSAECYQHVKRVGCSRDALGSLTSSDSGSEESSIKSANALSIYLPLAFRSHPKSPGTATLLMSGRDITSRSRDLLHCGQRFFGFFFKLHVYKINTVSLQSSGLKESYSFGFIHFSEVAWISFIPNYPIFAKFQPIMGSNRELWTRMSIIKTNFKWLAWQIW